jgi:hypothetical protein
MHYAAAWRDAPNEKSPRAHQIPVVVHLLKVYSEDASVPDDSGRLPCHHHWSKRAPLSVLEALLRANPAAG